LVGVVPVINKSKRSDGTGARGGGAASPAAAATPQPCTPPRPRRARPPPPPPRPARPRLRLPRRAPPLWGRACAAPFHPAPALSRWRGVYWGEMQRFRPLVGGKGWEGAWRRATARPRCAGLALLCPAARGRAGALRPRPTRPPPSRMRGRAEPRARLRKAVAHSKAPLRRTLCGGEGGRGRAGRKGGPARRCSAAVAR